MAIKGFEEGFIRLEPKCNEFLESNFYNLRYGVFLYKGTTKVLPIVKKIMTGKKLSLIDQYDWTNGSIWIYKVDSLGPYLERKIDDGE